MITFSKRVTVPADVVVTPVHGGAVLMNLSTNAYFSLDEVASRILTAATKAESLNAACDVLAEEYEVEDARLRADVDGLIGRLVEHGLIELR